MITSTYPELTVVNKDELAPGQWALGRAASGDSYALFMMTAAPSSKDEPSICWVLYIDDGSACFVPSSLLTEPVARLEGDVRVPLDVADNAPDYPGDYKPGLLYVSAFESELYLVAQVDRGRGAGGISISGNGGLRYGLDGPELWPTYRIEYRSPGDSEWSVLKRIEKPLESAKNVRG